MTSKRRDRSRPFGRHYQKFDRSTTSGEDHPVNAIIDKIPQVQALQRKLLRESKRVQAMCSDQRAFIALQDLRLELAIMRERLYFDAGHDFGLLTGRAEAHVVRTSNHALVRALSHQISLAAAADNIPAEQIAAALMDVARAMALGIPSR